MHITCMAHMVALASKEKSWPPKLSEFIFLPQVVSAVEISVSCSMIKTSLRASTRKRVSKPGLTSWNSTFAGSTHQNCCRNNWLWPGFWITWVFPKQFDWESLWQHLPGWHALMQSPATTILLPVCLWKSPCHPHRFSRVSVPYW